jgi:hypothetical protein
VESRNFIPKLEVEAFRFCKTNTVRREHCSGVAESLVRTAIPTDDFSLTSAHDNGFFKDIFLRFLIARGGNNCRNDLNHSFNCD